MSSSSTDSWARRSPLQDVPLVGVVNTGGPFRRTALRMLRLDPAPILRLRVQGKGGTLLGVFQKRSFSHQARVRHTRRKAYYGAGSNGSRAGAAVCRRVKAIQR